MKITYPLIQEIELLTTDTLNTCRALSATPIEGRDTRTVEQMGAALEQVQAELIDAYRQEGYALPNPLSSADWPWWANQAINLCRAFKFNPKTKII